MKSIFLLLGSGLLATTLAAAQDMPASSNPDPSPSKQTSQSTQTTSGLIRGCLSGSAGNYTITDQNGTQYQINGPDNQLQASVGHEVEVSTRQDQASATSTRGDQTTASTTNSVQVSNLRDIARSCTKGNSSGPSSMDNNGATPKGTPDAAEPPQPQTIAMLQQESKPDMGANPQQTVPPVTSQTPATPGASTNSAQQGNPPASSTTSTGQQSTSPSNTNGMSGSQVDQNAQGARQGQMNTTANTGSANGANPSSPATPSAAPSNPQQQQPNANDQNKPLYERQATDIPWANHSGDTTGNSGNPGTSNPPPQQ